jgi:hypothetical protein
MKLMLVKMLSFTQRIDRQHIQIALTLAALVLFVLGVGAPEDGGLTPH